MSDESDLNPDRNGRRAEHGHLEAGVELLERSLRAAACWQRRTNSQKLVFAHVLTPARLGVSQVVSAGQKFGVSTTVLIPF